MSTPDAENEATKPDPNAHDVQDASDQDAREEQAADPTAPDRGFDEHPEYSDAEPDEEQVP